MLKIQSSSLDPRLLKEVAAALPCAAIVYSLHVYSRIFHILVLYSSVNQPS